MSYEEVTEIFIRVNSLGAKLRSSDLALAQIAMVAGVAMTIWGLWQGRNGVRAIMRAPR